MRLLDRLGPQEDRVEVDVLAVELGLLAVQICFNAASCSSISAPRVVGSVPWLRISSRFHPTPTPKATRPSDTRSRLATCFAVWMTSRWGSSAIPVPEHQP